MRNEHGVTRLRDGGDLLAFGDAATGADVWLKDVQRSASDPCAVAELGKGLLARGDKMGIRDRLMSSTLVMKGS